MSLSPWEVLGVEAGASPAAVKAAHRRLTLLLHPDRYTEAPALVRAEANAAMQAVNAAYAVLTAAARGWTPKAPAPTPTGPTTAIERHRPRNRWDQALATELPRGRHTDLAA